MTAAGEVVLDILPALPSAWAATGRVTGLKGRGAFEVSFEWANGEVTRVVVNSLEGVPAVVRFNGREMKMSSEKRTLNVHRP